MATAPAQASLTDVCFDDVKLAAVTASAAEAAGVPCRALSLLALLQLPRLADDHGRLRDADMALEMGRLAGELSERIEPYRDWMAGPSQAPRRPQDLVLSTDDATADVLLERFHYLGSPRHDGPRFVAFTRDGYPAAVLTLSPCDLGWFECEFPQDMGANDVGVLSRVFAFDWVPRNSISYLLGDLVRRLDALRWRRRMLLTYLNPNLGFHGASYRAANWTLFARERETRYAYLDKRYITDRVLLQRFGSCDPDALSASLGTRIVFSHGPLAPLDVYARGLDPSTRRALAGREPRNVQRP